MLNASFFQFTHDCTFYIHISDLIIYPARESSLVLAGFLTARFLHKPYLLRVCCDVGFFCIAFMEEREIVEKLGRMDLSTLALSSTQLMQRSPTLLPPSQQKLHKSTLSTGNELSETLLGPGETLYPGK